MGSDLRVNLQRIVVRCGLMVRPSAISVYGTEPK